MENDPKEVHKCADCGEPVHPLQKHPSKKYGRWLCFSCFVKLEQIEKITSK